ncbi:MAG: radical SAM family heme chaperone HemW [Bacteroidaceae bacterium]|nr:radical SAM family heme chaperone HemW [Bacteroidaceae bacterium]
MAGIYVHVPFCKSRCAYCDFCSSTYAAPTRHAYTDALIAEIQARSQHSTGILFRTIYLGGGTPSVLTDADLGRIFHALRDNFAIVPDAEITLEANPDDVCAARVQTWQAMGVNRLSMGVQSLDDTMLRALGRRHTAHQAVEAVAAAVAAGLHNVSIDLMYGLPGLTLRAWERTLTEALALPVTHLSAYCLSVEDGTPIAASIARGDLTLPDDETCEAQYRMLVGKTREAGFTHYEISNFARPGFPSRHNSAYWDGTPYVGLGAAAHSFDGTTRRANTTDIRRYTTSAGNPPFDTETLSVRDRINEAIFLGLRTYEGINTKIFAERFGTDTLRRLSADAAPAISRGLLRQSPERLALTERGVFVSDDVISDLILV